MTAISLGVAWDLRTGRTGAPVGYDGERHLCLLGPSGCGKGVRLEIPNLLQLTGVSIVSIDPKGQNAAITAAWRRTVGDVLVLNPFGLLTDEYPDLASVGFNPLAMLDPDSPRFFEDAAAIGEALIKIEGNDPHWSESAQGLTVALVMWEVQTARRENRLPSLENVRDLLTEPEEMEAGRDGKAHLVTGLRATARKMVEDGDFQIGSLASRFLRDANELDSIKSTADTQTRWLLSTPMREDLAKNGIDFGQLKDGPRPTTVYVILPAEELEFHSVWLRLVISCALRALYKRGGEEGYRTLFLLSEFAQLGHLKPVSAALGQGRGYGAQLFPVLQDVNQLRGIYGRDHGETFLGMSGATFAFTPNDVETAEWMSKRSGEQSRMGVTASDSDGPEGARVSYQEQRRRNFPAGDLFNIPEGHGLVWYAGRSAPVPVYAPAWWEIEACRKRGRPDPYYRKSGRSSGPLSGFGWLRRRV